MQKLDCVLLVDDDEITNFLHESLIRDLGIGEEILKARNGQVALDIIRQRADTDNSIPSLILLDINMPVMNGFEFLEAYRRLDESIRRSLIIVVLTSSISPRDVKKTEELAKVDFINKPLNEEKLLSVVERNFSE